jgi:hypothetical protein
MFQRDLTARHDVSHSIAAQALAALRDTGIRAPFQRSVYDFDFPGR